MQELLAAQRHTLGVVGESGSGKTTRGQTLVEPIGIHAIGVDAQARERKARD